MKTKTTIPTRPLTPAAMFFLLAALFALLGGALCFLLDHYCFHDYPENDPFDIHHARLTILVTLAVLLLTNFLYIYRFWLRKTRRKLYENGAVNRLLYHNSNDAVFLYPLARNGNLATILSANDVACQRLGYTREEFSTRTMESIAPQHTADQREEHTNALLSGKLVRFETLHVAKDGRTIPVEMTLHPLADKRHPMVLALARELTEYKALAEESRRANEALRVLSRHAPLAIVAFDRNLIVTRWNEAAEQLFGWSKADVLGHVLSSVLHSEVHAITALYTRVLHGETLTSVKMRHPRKDGAMVDVSLWLTPTCDTAGEVNGLIGIIADLTERIRTDEELLHVNRALKVLSEAKRAVARATDESTLLHDVCHLLINTGGYRFAWIGVAQSPNEQSITPLAYVGDGDWYLDVVNPSWRDLKQESNPTVKAIRHGRVTIVKNLLCFPDPASWLAESLNRGYGSVIAFPVTAWQPYGALTIFAGELAAFDEEEVELLSELADDIAYGIESLRLRDERRLAEDALLAYAQQWRTTFDAISDPVFVVDPAGSITQCNKALTYFIGIPYDKIIGTRACNLFHGTSEYLEACLLSHVQEVRRSESDIFPIEDRFYKVTFDPLINGEGQHLGSIQVMDDVTERIRVEEEFRENFVRLQGLLNNTITTIAKIVEMRDPYTAGHEHRVSLLACSIAREMGLSDDTLEGIRVSGMLHDIGKLYVPAEILSKTGVLNEIEVVMIRMHAQAGYETLKNIDFPWPVAKIVQQHHERLDGSGYPTGLSGDDILIEARILAVADVVDSMASHRPYRPARGIEATLQEIESNSGSLYDPDVSAACRRLFLEQGFTLDYTSNS